MFNRENAVGLLLLAFCAVVAGIMVYVIATGRRITLDLPPGVGVALGILFFGLIVFGLTRNIRTHRQTGGGRAWPDPNTGNRSLWDRIRGRR